MHTEFNNLPKNLMEHINLTKLTLSIFLLLMSVTALVLRENISIVVLFVFVFLLELTTPTYNLTAGHDLYLTSVVLLEIVDGLMITVDGTTWKP